MCLETSKKEKADAFDVSANKAFKCQSRSQVDGFTGSVNASLSSMYTWDVEVEAFRTEKKAEFSDGKQINALFMLHIYIQH